MSRRLTAIAAVLVGLLGGRTHAADLPSWSEGPAKAAILDFVADVTTAGGADFVPASERIATFDNAGTPWIEQPIYN